MGASAAVRYRPSGAEAAPGYSEVLIVYYYIIILYQILYKTPTRYYLN